MTPLEITICALLIVGVWAGTCAFICLFFAVCEASEDNRDQHPRHRESDWLRDAVVKGRGGRIHNGDMNDAA